MWSHKALHKIPQKTVTELPYSIEYRLSGEIVDQKCSVHFLCIFLAVDVVQFTIRVY